MKPFTAITIVFLSLLALLQAIRFLQGWTVVVNGITVPLWASAIAAVIAAGLALMVWRESRR
jgi:hypothetical protein